MTKDTQETVTDDVGALDNFLPDTNGDVSRILGMADYDPNYTPESADPFMGPDGQDISAAGWFPHGLKGYRFVGRVIAKYSAPATHPGAKKSDRAEYYEAIGRVITPSGVAKIDAGGQPDADEVLSYSRINIRASARLSPLDRLVQKPYNVRITVGDCDATTDPKKNPARNYHIIATPA